MKKAALIIAHVAVLIQCAIVMSLLCQMKRTYGHDLVMLCEIIIFILTLIQLYLALDIKKREAKLEFPLYDSQGRIKGWTGPYKTYDDITPQEYKGFTGSDTSNNSRFTYINGRKTYY